MVRSQCGACHEIFASTQAFDAHRIGRFTRNARRCLTKREMQARGMIKNSKGWWMELLTTSPAPWYVSSLETSPPQKKGRGAR
jgi:hypothetical protein